MHDDPLKSSVEAARLGLQTARTNLEQAVAALRTTQRLAANLDRRLTSGAPVPSWLVAAPGADAAADSGGSKSVD
jgi:hypothetical protein